MTDALIPNLVAVLVFLTQLAAAALNGHCPPLGAVLPAPKHPSTSSTVQEAIYNFQNDFTNLTSVFSGTAVSVSVKSLHQLDKLIDLHYTPPVRDPNSTNMVDANTVYRIASISKVFTTLGLLLSGHGMDDHVTMRLLNTEPIWNNMTIGALASHMSGLGLDCEEAPFHIGSFSGQFADNTHIQ